MTPFTATTNNRRGAINHRRLFPEPPPSPASGDGFRGSVHHLIDDLEDPRPRVDAGVFPGHGRRPRPIARLTEHGADRLAQRRRRRLIGLEVDADPKPGDAGAHIRLVPGLSPADA